MYVDKQANYTGNHKLTFSSALLLGVCVCVLLLVLIYK